jgi:hypothetical protein
MSLPYHAHALQPYYSLIDEALSARNASNGDFETDREHGVPVFVSRMCAKLAEVCVERGQTAATIKDVLRLDAMASGHTDYHRKLALYCRELEQFGPGRVKL